VLAEKWGQRPDQILDGMTSAELSEAIAYYLLVQDEQNETAEQRAERERIDRALEDARRANAQARGMGG
jgi:hypothetical protein